MSSPQQSSRCDVHNTPPRTLCNAAPLLLLVIVVYCEVVVTPVRLMIVIIIYIYFYEMHYIINNVSLFFVLILLSYDSTIERS